MKLNIVKRATSPILKNQWILQEENNISKNCCMKILLKFMENPAQKNCKQM